MSLSAKYINDTFNLTSGKIDIKSFDALPHGYIISDQDAISKTSLLIYEDILEECVIVIIYENNQESSFTSYSYSEKYRQWIINQRPSDASS